MLLHESDQDGRDQNDHDTVDGPHGGRHLGRGFDAVPLAELDRQHVAEFRVAEEDQEQDDEEGQKDRPLQDDPEQGVAGFRVF